MASKSRLGSSGFGIKRRGSFSGKAVDLGIIVDQFINVTTKVFTGPQKPGIPSGTDPWLKNMLEIMNGRRGNAIDVPDIPELTFSSTPTQAQCEALYDALKITNDRLRQLKNRFDS